MKHSEISAALTFQKAAARDFDELATLRVTAMRESLERVGRFDPVRARERLRSTFSPEQTHFIVCDGAKAGFYAARISDQGLQLDHLYLHPDYQGQGIGSAVLKVILADADKREVAVFVGALKESASNRFYQRHGFVVNGESEWDIHYVRPVSTSHPQDHFSPIASRYARSRIGYPPELFGFLAGQCRARHLAWDCATGSGQAAGDIAGHFDRVVATDISQELLDFAPLHPRIVYRRVPAEESGIDAGSVDLVTVAQALHWFDLDRFWTEVRHVLKPGGVLAFWGYTWPRVDPEIDRLLVELRNVIAPDWPQRSGLLHAEYATVRAPFEPLEAPQFIAEVQWSLDDYLNHLRTWSALHRHQMRTGKDVLNEFAPRLSAAWNDGPKDVSWPLHTKVYRRL